MKSETLVKRIKCASCNDDNFNVIHNFGDVPWYESFNVKLLELKLLGADGIEFIWNVIPVYESDCAVKSGVALTLRFKL